MDVPFWIILVAVGIVISGIMIVRLEKEQRKKETDDIEQEGQVYLERIDEEKEKRRQFSSS